MPFVEVERRYVDTDVNNICGVCNAVLDFKDAVQCTKCSVTMHDKCGELDLANEQDIICSICSRGKRILENQVDCHKRQKIGRDKIVHSLKRNFHL